MCETNLNTEFLKWAEEKAGKERQKKYEKDKQKFKTAKDKYHSRYSHYGYPNDDYDCKK